MSESIANRVVALPDREGMLRRLQAILDDESVREKFYDKLLDSAGERKNADEIVVLIFTAMEEAVSGLSACLSGQLLAALMERINDFIDALVDDGEVASLIKKAIRLATCTVKMEAGGKGLGTP